MKIRLGEKIRELRGRDLRTQENLAQALGVTPQAVSRWESGSGYPDMELVPSIANYFGVTIDQLFGYDNERTIKIKEITDKAEVFINAQEDMEECITMLREAAAEFPSEQKIFLPLGFALYLQGIKKHGIGAGTEENGEYSHFDKEYNQNNEYFRESETALRRALEMGISSDERTAVITVLLRIYQYTGEYEKAEKIASERDSLLICRECLLPATAEGERRDKYLGEIVLALARQVKIAIENVVFTKISITKSENAEEKLLCAARLFEAVMEDGNFGWYNMDLRDIYLELAYLAASRGDTDKAMRCFHTGYSHEKTYKALRGNGSYNYTAPIVSKVIENSDNWPIIPSYSWDIWIKGMPANLKEAIKESGQYADVGIG